MQGIGVFSRISASPSDRNLIDFYLDGGVVFSGLVPGRPEDRFGASFIYANISDRARDLDRDRVFYDSAPYPIRDFELLLEFTYQAQIMPGWTVQPEIQYVIHPSGNVPNPNDPLSTPIKDALVLGIRSVINY